MSRSWIVLPVIAAALGVAPRVAAQEIVKEYPGLETGTMWTFDVPPLEYWAARYGFRPTAAWLEHVRLSAARQPGCTASFVSANGLVMTNHHCARSCITAVTHEGEDLLANGFYAKTHAEERACSNRYLDQLLSIRDVTDSVTGAVPAGASPTAAADARARMIVDIQNRCAATGANLNCQVVTMYRGGQYKLYTFRRYADVRLVFAPDGQAAFFGGDPDNFTYPRYDMDISFYRVYEGGRPLQTQQYFKWSAAGSSEGDLVFVVGNPGSTGRLNTVAQLEYLRDVQYPAQLDGYARQIAVLHELADADPERASALRNEIFGLENSRKAVTGYQSGLLDPSLMTWKEHWEQSFRTKVQADPTLKAKYGNAWDAIATINKKLASLDLHRRYYSFNAMGTHLLSVAGTLVQAPAEMAKPDGERMGIYREGNRRRLERMLAGQADTLMERMMLTAWLQAMANDLPATDPVRRAALGDRTPEAAAAAMVARTVLTDPNQVHALLEGGEAASAASNDPFVKLARVIDPLEREVSAAVTTLRDAEAQQNELIARALLAVFGSSVAPDATFSLRISDGVVARYPYNGTFAAPYTTFYGLYDRWTAFGGKDPWQMTQRWIDAKDKINLATPLDGVSTNDIIGGNSGSPVINRDAEIVGLIFDGNIEMLPNRFLYTQRVARSVWVDGRGILEALRSVYGATDLANELLGR
jgi:hypothetical protein